MVQSSVLQGYGHGADIGNTVGEPPFEVTAQSEWYWSERTGRAQPRSPDRRAMRLARREITLLREWHDRVPDPAYLQRMAELDRWIATLEGRIDL